MGLIMNPYELTLAFHQAYIQRYEIAVPNTHIGDHEWDICAVRKRSYFVDEVEIKISRSDFLADFKKSGYHKVPLPNPNRSEFDYRSVYKHEKTCCGERLCNYFWFLMPEELAEQCIDDIPDYAGLLVGYDYNGVTKIKELKSAPRLHNRKPNKSGDFLYRLARKGLYRYWDLAHSNYLNKTGEM